MKKFNFMCLEFALILDCEKFVWLCNLMNVFENFYNLWHDNNFFNNFFQNVWNFDKYLLSDSDFHWNSFYLLNYFDDSLNVIDILDDFLHLL